MKKKSIVFVVLILILNAFLFSSVKPLKSNLKFSDLYLQANAQDETINGGTIGDCECFSAKRWVEEEGPNGVKQKVCKSITVEKGVTSEC